MALVALIAATLFLAALAIPARRPEPVRVKARARR